MLVVYKSFYLTVQLLLITLTYPYQSVQLHVYYMFATGTRDGARSGTPLDTRVSKLWNVIA